MEKIIRMGSGLWLRTCQYIERIKIKELEVIKWKFKKEREKERL